MRALVSVDLEGMPYIVSREHVHLKGALYSEARKVMTEVTLCVVEELHNKGFREIIIADSHGPMVNILVEELPEYVQLVRGFPRPVSMTSGIEECDVALFLGYHAKVGTVKSTFDHTFSGSTFELVEINGNPASEYLLNAYVAGHYNVPVILVAGDEKLLEDVREHTPWAETVPLKRSYSRYAAISPSLKRIKKELREAVSRAVKKYKNGATKPLKTKYPVTMRIRFTNSAMADIAELLPFVKRIDGKTITYTSKDIVDAYKIMELLAIASYSVLR
ncbi:MAG: M55 family metallopeptidase [Euryarchaeota archaeon]|nr:M55 family metallopeptidase [Euryarchaeota archaeon]HHC18863.1 peptide transporter [Euryarchaeota archaeon]